MKNSLYILLVFMGLLVILFIVNEFRYVHFSTYESPDKVYAFEVYRDRIYWGFPGSGSDSPARLRLINSRSCKTPICDFPGAA